MRGTRTLWFLRTKGKGAFRRTLRVARLFDPWGSKYCTCPPKYSLNPYTGCSHACFYCYITSYIPNPFLSRPKKNLLKNLWHDLTLLEEGSLISMSNSTDPYPPLEKDLLLTRRILEMIKEFPVRLLIITKSSLVTRDIELLKELPAAVTISLTSMDETLTRRMEPNAPSPKERIEALKKLSLAGIPTALRLDPIIPGLTDGEIELLIEKVAPWVKHITLSTFKPRHDSFKRFKEKFLNVYRKTRALYKDKRDNSFYLEEKIRKELLRRGYEKAKKLGLSIGTCREGFREFQNAPSCDGSHLILWN